MASVTLRRFRWCQANRYSLRTLIRDAKLQKKIGRIKTTILRPNGKNYATGSTRCRF